MRPAASAARTRNTRFTGLRPTVRIPPADGSRPVAPLRAPTLRPALPLHGGGPCSPAWPASRSGMDAARLATPPGGPCPRDPPGNGGDRPSLPRRDPRPTADGKSCADRAILGADGAAERMLMHVSAWRVGAVQISPWRAVRAAQDRHEDAAAAMLAPRRPKPVRASAAVGPREEGEVGCGDPQAVRAMALAVGRARRPRQVRPGRGSRGQPA